MVSKTIDGSSNLSASAFYMAHSSIGQDTRFSFLEEQFDSAMRYYQFIKRDMVFNGSILGLGPSGVVSSTAIPTKK